MKPTASPSVFSVSAFVVVFAHTVQFTLSGTPRDFSQGWSGSTPKPKVITEFTSYEFYYDVGVVDYTNKLRTKSI